LQNIKAQILKDSRWQLANGGDMHFGFIKFSGCDRYGLNCNNARVNEFIWDGVRKSNEIQQLKMLAKMERQQWSGKNQNVY